ncbi:hypothetical protein [Bacillus litorisediminis]|uniref:hypothetical protein n=1 Tax=Bacillus litorisediminis TaxID=2922713 RepID=UPI001FAC4196|nr:hypothetical protein [Bacillus litorisediminis]
MLDTFIHYNDLRLEMEVVKEQIYFTEKELEYWFGIRMHDKELEGIPLGAIGVHKFGVPAALEQAEKKINAINKLRDRLEKLETEEGKIRELLSRFKGLEYKIAYMKYVERKTLREIAEELCYSYDYIREVHSRMKTHNEPTDSIAIS